MDGRTHVCIWTYMLLRTSLMCIHVLYMLPQGSEWKKRGWGGWGGEREREKTTAKYHDKNKPHLTLGVFCSVDL